MKNCFTTVYKYLSSKYKVPTKWKEYTNKDMDLFVKEEKRFLATRKHFKFFLSFCTRVDKAQEDDIVLTKKSVGCAINRFAYWVYCEDQKDIITKPLDKDCTILRINNG